VHIAQYGNGSPAHCWVTTFDTHPVEWTNNLYVQEESVGLPGVLDTHASSAVDLLG
jgi:hypothetical protein